MNRFDSTQAKIRSQHGRTAYGYDMNRNGNASIAEFRNGRVHRDIGDVASDAICGGVSARFTVEQMADAICAGLEAALPVIDLATDEATDAIVRALEAGGVDALDSLRENRAAAVASGRQ